MLQVLRAVEEVTGRSVPYQMGSRRAGDPAVLAWQFEKKSRAC